jgi:hypothetical protein
MNRFIVKRWRLGTAVVSILLVVACEQSGAPSQTETSPSLSQDVKSPSAPLEQTNDRTPSKSEAVRIATDWVNALRVGDRAKLQALAVVPFEIEELVEYPKCKPKRTDKPASVPDTLDCFLSDKLLMEELAAQPEPVTEAVSESELHAWATKLKGGSHPGQLVQVLLPGNGVSYEFLILTTALGVKRVWKFVEYDPN